MNDTQNMTLDRFEALLEAHGCDLVRWQADEAAAARQLLAHSALARSALQEAESLSQLLDAAPKGDVHAALTARVLAGMPDGEAASPLNVASKVLRVLWPQFGWLRPASLVAASLAAGLYVGATATTTAASDQQADIFAYVFELPEAWETGDAP